MYRHREIKIDGMTFETEVIRKGYFLFRVVNPATGQFTDAGEGIHGRPSDRKAQKHMVHYGKQAIERANKPVDA